MDFSEALRVCKTGGKITRDSWNAAGQYVVAQAGYPDGVMINSNTAKATGFEEGTVCKFAPYLLLRNAQRIFVPWAPTQGDLFAWDWEVLDA